MTPYNLALALITIATLCLFVFEARSADPEMIRTEPMVWQWTPATGAVRYGIVCAVVGFNAAGKDGDWSKVSELTAVPVPEPGQEALLAGLGMLWLLRKGRE